MKKLLITLLAFGSFSAFADTYCGDLAITYLDKHEGGPGAIYTLEVADYLDKSEGGPGSILNKYSLSGPSATAAEKDLTASILGLMEDGKSYCIEGKVTKKTLSFTKVTID